MSAEKFKRVNILITPAQYQAVQEQELSLSGLVRDLLDDRLGQTSIWLTVSEETKALYDTVVSNFGSDDSELEPYLIEALDRFLCDKSAQIGELRDRLRTKKV